MEKIVRKYTRYKEMKADEYRYWQSRVHERMAAVSELTTAAYALIAFGAPLAGIAVSDLADPGKSRKRQGAL